MLEGYNLNATTEKKKVDNWVNSLLIRCDKNLPEDIFAGKTLAFKFDFLLKSVKLQLEEKEQAEDENYEDEVNPIGIKTVGQIPESQDQAIVSDPY